MIEQAGSNRRDAPDSARGFLERGAETVAAVLAMAVYVLLVSRGEVLPYEGVARALTAPGLALVAAGLVGWRARRLIEVVVRSRALWRWTPLGLAVVLAALLRAALGDLNRPAAPAETAVLTWTWLFLTDEPLPATELGTLLLALLHAPVAAARYMVGVSAGLWREIDKVPLAQILPWSRAAHLGGSLVAVVLTGVAAGKLAGPVAGWLAAGLLAIAGASLAAATTVDLAVPGSLLVALLALATSGPLAGRRLADRPVRWSRPVAIGLGLVGLMVLWLPGTVAAVAAPAVAVVVAVALVGAGSLRTTEPPRAPR